MRDAGVRCGIPFAPVTVRHRRGIATGVPDVCCGVIRAKNVDAAASLGFMLLSCINIVARTQHDDGSTALQSGVVQTSCTQSFI